MDIVYHILDIYLGFFKGFFSLFLRHSTEENFVSFSSYFIPFYYTITPLWYDFEGERDESVFFTIFLSFFTTGMIYVMRGMGDLDFTSGYFLLGYFLMLGSGITRLGEVQIISDGIKKSKK